MLGNALCVEITAILRDVTKRMVGSARKCTLVSAFALVSFGQTAHAATISYLAEGTLTSVGLGLSAEFSVGAAVSLGFSYQTSTPDSDPAPNSGFYVNPGISALGSVGSYTFSSGAGSGSIVSSDSDYFRIWYNIVGSNIGGYTPQFAAISLGDSTGTALTNDAIPTDLALFDSATIELAFGNGFNQYALVADVSRISQVSQTPLPAALPLFATGLGLMGLLGWRRKRKGTAVAA